MKYIRKLRPPQSFIDWFEANNAHLQATCATGDEIWSRLDRTVKKDLNDALLQEQGHICAYCGTRIGKKELLLTEISEEELLTFCIEHFLRKGDDNYKRLTLEYSNLLGCCKISQLEGVFQTIPFPIETQPHLKTLNDIADYLNVTIEHLKKNSRVLRKVNETADLDAINNQKPEGHKITISYKANIHHCDDTKFDRTDAIVNPITEVNCEQYFRYTLSKNPKNVDFVR
jgi:hypothetical protein